MMKTVGLGTLVVYTSDADDGAYRSDADDGAYVMVHK
jgi:hypothetical protein